LERLIVHQQCGISITPFTLWDKRYNEYADE